eukprot:149007_1
MEVDQHIKNELEYRTLIDISNMSASIAEELDHTTRKEIMKVLKPTLTQYKPKHIRFKHAREISSNGISDECAIIEAYNAIVNEMMTPDNSTNNNDISAQCSESAIEEAFANTVKIIRGLTHKEPIHPVDLVKIEIGRAKNFLQMEQLSKIDYTSTGTFYVAPVTLSNEKRDAVFLGVIRA